MAKVPDPTSATGQVSLETSHSTILDEAVLVNHIGGWEGQHETAAPAAANAAIPISKFMNAGVSDGPGLIVSSFSFPKISNVQIYFTRNEPGVSKMT